MKKKFRPYSVFVILRTSASPGFNDQVRIPASENLTFGEFPGGLELLCNSVKIHNVNVEMQNGAEKLTMKDLLSWIRTHLIKERPEMFMKGDTVRPGVLALVNDCDWELSGQLDTTLEEKDVVVFISTLHSE
ncbi:ubiquitin-related modifier 1 homolog 2-like [Pyrus x bretschneideri]|uniref:ubiquitin-related modifier 1 homolog 2-like n=1 Tax=Pyrus x bretschneideri TaxID=225117 RepID=UPI002030C605|nr:ubiquitin-related modifier 1 homolog 2-like [Pyrus x bretschneideri]